MHWEPSASLATLRLADNLRHSIRHWMREQGIVEVCTPPLSLAANPDASVEPLVIRGEAQTRYLHTSPEFGMKRILAAYPEIDIYQIATVFRAEELGRYHSSQFSLLEWYRLGYDHQALITEVCQLLEHVYISLQQTMPSVEHCSYVESVKTRLGHWPHDLDTAKIQRYFDEHGRSFPCAIADDLPACLDLFIDEFVLPDFPTHSFTVMTDYPTTHAALANIGRNEAGVPVAERFELYFGSIELANGFHELTDAREQRRRFGLDCQKRLIDAKPPLPQDDYFLAALEHGLPACAGVALGLDRLLMVLGQHEQIEQVLSFDDQRA